MTLILESRIVAALICLNLGVAVGAQAQGPRQQPRLVLQALDLNRDGTLSANEIAVASASLLTLDRNGDGTLTNDELSSRPENAGASSDELLKQLMSFDKTDKGYLVPADLPERMQGFFVRADANRDGKVTPEEISALSAKQGMPNGAATPGGRAGGMFRMDPLLNALDADHDGVISVAEIAGASKELLTLDANGDGQLTTEEIRVRQQTPEERVNHMMDEWDTNKDGRLARAEAPERMGAQFDAIDSNHDGFLDKAELLAYYKAQGNGGPR